MSTAGALPQVTSPRQNGSESNTPRADGERHEPTPKSSNSLSSSRRKLSSGRHSAGRLFSFSSAFPGNLVVSSAMALSPDIRKLRRKRQTRAASQRPRSRSTFRYDPSVALDDWGGSL